MFLTKEECMACLNQFMEDTNYYVVDVTYNDHKEEFDILSQLIQEHFNPKENTIEFKNFKLHSDRALKSMPKDELISYIHMLHHNWSVCDEQLCNVIKLNKKFDKALDNAIKECCIGVTGSDACNSLEELYKAFEGKVWKDVD